MHFTPDVTLGTLIHLITLLGAIVLGYYRLRDRQREIELQLEKVAVALTALNHTYVRSEVYAAHQETIAGRLTEIKEDVTDLRGDMKSILLRQP